ncbi:class C beta-lactamase [Taklimakanibacter lacteus]|uniref:class C beta-lactamase n=1 Tax=Taklimakanibacter lacteus TaxID=2268456 RepID=UPI0013C507E9
MISVARTSGAFAFALSCLSGTGQAAGDSDKISAAVDQAFRPLMQEYDVPGIAVAVTVDGERYFFNYGVAAKDTRKPVTKDTLFELGSVSKTFTATLGTYAVIQGKMSLDDHPSRHMPQLRGAAADKASLLHFGTYTAGGLPLQIPNSVTDNTKMAAYFKQWKPATAPGTARRYSNPSIGLFGYVTARALKGDYASLVESEILPGLGLRHSYINVPKAAMADYAWGYNKANKPVRVNPGVFGAEAYGVKSSSADMIHYVEANIGPDMLDAPMKRAIEDTHIAYFEVGEMTQGLGWEQYPYPVTLDRLLAGNSSRMSRESHEATPFVPPRAPSGPMFFNKTGSTNGFSSYVAFVPERKIGIVMLANRSFPIPARITAAYAVLKALEGR